MQLRLLLEGSGLSCAYAWCWEEARIAATV